MVVSVSNSPSTYYPAHIFPDTHTQMCTHPHWCTCLEPLHLHTCLALVAGLHTQWTCVCFLYVGKKTKMCIQTLRYQHVSGCREEGDRQGPHVIGSHVEHKEHLMANCCLTYKERSRSTEVSIHVTLMMMISPKTAFT